MQAKLCDRCGAVIKEKRENVTKSVSENGRVTPNSDWEYILKKLDLVQLRDKISNSVGDLDLCISCKHEFINWIHQGSLYTK